MKKQKLQWLKLNDKIYWYVISTWFGVLPSIGLFFISLIIISGISSYFPLIENYSKIITTGFYILITFFTLSISYPKARFFRRTLVITSLIVSILYVAFTK